MGNPKKPVKISTVVFTFIYILIFPVLFFLLSGDWRWVESWIFNLWFTVCCFATIIYLYIKNPALLAERYRQPGAAGHKKWDIYITYGLFAGYIIWMAIMPLDAKRYQWTASFPLWAKILGGLALFWSFYFFFRSYKDNSFLSPLVRIQKERGQQVVSTGVYGLVRHPMYLGGILLFLGAPLLLGSSYGIIAGLILSFLLVGRTLGEEKMLIEELDGYREYKQKVRYRLLPYLW